MTEMITIKPAPDRRARHENGRLLAAGGEMVARSPYWLRRLADEDVVATGQIEAAAADDAASATEQGDPGTGSGRSRGRKGAAQGDDA